jgi:hypothetical protein
MPADLAVVAPQLATLRAPLGRRSGQGGRPPRVRPQGPPAFTCVAAPSGPDCLAVGSVPRGLSPRVSGREPRAPTVASLASRSPCVPEEGEDGDRVRDEDKIDANV